MLFSFLTLRPFVLGPLWFERESMLRRDGEKCNGTSRNVNSPYTCVEGGRDHGRRQDADRPRVRGVSPGGNRKGANVDTAETPAGGGASPAGGETEIAQDRSGDAGAVQGGGVDGAAVPAPAARLEQKEAETEGQEGPRIVPSFALTGGLPIVGMPVAEHAIA